MSTTKFLREKTHIKRLVESLKPVLDICYTIWNQILYYMSILGQFFLLQDCLLHPQLNVRTPFEFWYLANQFYLGSFIMFTKNFPIC